MAENLTKQARELFFGSPLLCPNAKCLSPEKNGKKLSSSQIELFNGQSKTGYCKKCGWIVKRCQNMISFGKKIIKTIDCQACNYTNGRFCRWCKAENHSMIIESWQNLFFTAADGDTENKSVSSFGKEFTVLAANESDEVFVGSQYLKAGNYLICITKSGDVFRISPASGSSNKVVGLTIKGTSTLEMHGVDHYFLASGLNNAFVYNSALDRFWQWNFQNNFDENLELLSGLSIAYPRSPGREELLLAVVRSRKGSRDKYFLAIFNLFQEDSKAKVPSIRNKIELKISDKDKASKFQIFYVKKNDNLAVLIISEFGYWECSLDFTVEKESSTDYSAFSPTGQGQRKEISLPIKIHSTSHYSSEMCDRLNSTRLEFFVETFLHDQNFNLVTQNSKVEQIVFHLPERNQKIACYFNEICDGSLIDQCGESVAFLSKSSGQPKRPVYQCGFMGQENPINEISNYSAGLVFISENLLAWKAGNNKICLKRISAPGMTRSSEYGTKSANHYCEVDEAICYPFAFDRALVFPKTTQENKKNVNKLLIHWFYDK